MSIRVMSRVWESAEVSGGSLLVLLALADYAGEDGEAWPSVKALAAKARLSERQTQQILRDLEGQGLIAIALNSGPRGVNLYRVSEGGAKTAGVRSPDREGGAAHRTQTVIEPSVALSTTKLRPQPSRQTKAAQTYPRSDDSDKDRPPGAKVERWLVGEMSKHFGAKVVQRQLERCDLFFVWRKVKQYVDDGDRGTLKELLPRAQAEYEAEAEQIVPDAPLTEHQEQTLAIYQGIEADRRAEYDAEYAAWEQETYPAVTGAQ